MSRRNTIILIFFIFVFALFIRCVAWYMEPELARDSIYYLTLVDDPNTAGCFRPPLFVECMRIIKAAGGEPHIGGLIVNIVAGSLIPALFFFIACELKFEFRWRVVAAVMASVHPRLIQYSVELLRESLYLFFSTLLIYFVSVAIMRDKLWQWSCVGVCGALAALCRFEALELVPIVFVIIACRNFAVKRTCRYNILTLSLFIFGWIVTFLSLSYCFNMPIAIFKNGVEFYFER